jgi:hypothetical protein
MYEVIAQRYCKVKIQHVVPRYTGQSSGVKDRDKRERNWKEL